MNMKDKLFHDGDIAVFKKDFTVMYSDIDMTGSVTMPAICNYFFEIGSIHGRILTEDAELDSIFVLTRLYVKMEKYPSVEETVSIRSWLSPVKDRYVIRNFLISDAEGDIIGRGKTSAVPFDINGRKGGAVPENMMKVKTVDTEPASDHVIEKLHQVISPVYRKNFEVRYFECDINMHANNVRYIQWCIETLPVDFIKSHVLHEIDVNYRAESSVGDMLKSSAEPLNDGYSFIHTISGHAEMKDLTRMKSSWRKK